MIYGGINLKKITFLMLHLNYGGLEKQTITLVNELAKTGEYDITIISVYDMLHGRSFYDIDKNVKVEFCEKESILDLYDLVHIIRNFITL